MSDFDCVYCGEPIEVCYDDGHGMDEDRAHDDECPHCDKPYRFTTSFIVTHEPQCWPGTHDYELTEFDGERMLRCRRCDDMAFEHAPTLHTDEQREAFAALQDTK